MMRFRAVIFDLDGTLVDSYPAILESLNDTRLAFGLPPYDLQTVKTMVGRGLENLMRQALGDERYEEGMAVFRKSYDETHLRGTFLLPGVRQTLAELKARGVRMAVATNKPSDYSRNILRHLEVESYFMDCSGPDRAGCTKPNPAMLNGLMIALQVRPMETLYVGEMVLDLETARNAGVRLALIATGGNTFAEL
ncbi:MAG TPA: HAD-IA family hydrolase [Acidobacteriota bacterium]|nr:HAD-IA family hydrolase [Acidobacteriota bacterium]